MSQDSAVDFFFRQRWPDGFRCPSCAHRDYSLIRTRTLPLYQCRSCKRQTSVTSGTVMHKTRTPLKTWADAIEALSSSHGLNAKQLAASIGCTHKVAWGMLTKFRASIEAIESARRLEGNVHVGLRSLAPKYIWIFLPNRHYRCERVVSVGASVDASGQPTAIKLLTVSRRELIEDHKEPTNEGRRRIVADTARRPEDAVWHNGWRRFPDTLNDCFREARGWLIQTYNGIGTRRLHSYLSEYCYRWNAAAQGVALRDEWLRLCFPMG